MICETSDSSASTDPVAVGPGHDAVTVTPVRVSPPERLPTERRRGGFGRAVDGLYGPG